MTEMLSSFEKVDFTFPQYKKLYYWSLIKINILLLLHVHNGHKSGIQAASFPEIIWDLWEVASHKFVIYFLKRKWRMA